MQTRILTILLALLVGVFTHTVVYFWGKEECKNEQLQAFQQDTPKQVRENVDRADRTSNTFRNMDDQHERNLQALDQAVAARQLPSDCNLSDDELRAFQDLTATTGSSLPSEGDGAVQALESNNQ